MEPESFWAEQAESLVWFSKWKKIRDCSFSSPVRIRWFEGGKLNVTVNCLDRHLEKRAEQVALLWEPDDPHVASRSVTYRELHEEVSRFSNVLRELGVKRGDRVTIYLPMIPEAAFAMLACARIGAVHSVVFAGFSAEALADRIVDCESHFVITADQGVRGGKRIDLKKNVDEAIDKILTRRPERVLMIRYTGADVPWNSARDVDYQKIRLGISMDSQPEIMDAEDPLFILYTSGSTNKPKGVLHTTAGYLLYASLTHRYAFDYREGEVYWCTADLGWVTGHSYLLYGPLANGATTLMFEGTPQYPSPSRFWEVIDKHRVNIFYTAPTAIRALMREGEELVKKTSRRSLRILGTVGEPINPEAWLWYERVVGEGRCPIVDTWWQTETGGVMIAPLPGAIKAKPGSATLPFFGVKPVIIDDEGKELPGECRGNLCIAESWPGQMRTVYRDHRRFEETYFSRFPGKYFTGDGCQRDSDGYHWITGRVDDVVNVAGHRLGTAEIESALVSHGRVAEAAVVGVPHDLKGQGIYAFVTLKAGVSPSEELKRELIQQVRKEIGPIASPDFIQWAPGLPKTRSGKIMRRILRKIAEGECQDFGDTSSLADPGVVEELIGGRYTQL